MLYPLWILTNLNVSLMHAFRYFRLSIFVASRDASFCGKTSQISLYSRSCFSGCSANWYSTEATEVEVCKIIPIINNFCRSCDRRIVWYEKFFIITRHFFYNETHLQYQCQLGTNLGQEWTLLSYRPREQALSLKVIVLCRTACRSWFLIERRLCIWILCWDTVYFR